MKHKEDLLKEIENFACHCSWTQRMFLTCPIDETVQLKNINDSLERFKNKLDNKAKEFLEAFPEETKEKLDKFISDIECFESLIFDENRKIEKFQNRKNELLNNFLNN